MICCLYLSQWHICNSEVVCMKHSDALYADALQICYVYAYMLRIYHSARARCIGLVAHFVCRAEEVVELLA